MNAVAMSSRTTKWPNIFVCGDFGEIGRTILKHNKAVKEGVIDLMGKISS